MLSSKAQIKMKNHIIETQAADALATGRTDDLCNILWGSVARLCLLPLGKPQQIRLSLPGFPVILRFLLDLCLYLQPYSSISCLFRIAVHKDNLVLYIRLWLLGEQSIW